MRRSYSAAGTFSLSLSRLDIEKPPGDIHRWRRTNLVVTGLWLLAFVQSPGKKVSGIKRHIAVDTQGLPHAIHVTTANVTDRAGALAMFDRRRANLSQVQNVLVDGGYTGKPFATAVQSLLGASVEVVKRNELHTFVVLPKRWVVERSFGWLEKCRRLWKNCERKLNTSLQMVVLAFAVLILKRL